MIRLSILITMALLLNSCNKAVDSFQLASPDGTILVQLEIIDRSPHYSVSIDGEQVIKPSALGFKLSQGPVYYGYVNLKQTASALNNSTWEQVLGEDKQILDHNNYAKFQVLIGNTEFYNLEFKIFNDGVAFRYLFPDWPGVDSLLIQNENTAFNFPEDYLAWWIPNEWDSYEQVYQTTPISKSTGVNTPVTLRSESGIHLSIHEANLTEYSGMTLVPDTAGSINWHSALVPWPDGIKVRSTLPHNSPWRSIQLGRSAADLANSHLILNLNEPNRIADVSWIKPMKYMGIWWGMHIDKETWYQGPTHGATTTNALRYINYASKNGFAGLLIEGWNLGWENWGEQDAYRFDETYDDFDIQRVTSYAAERGIEIIGHHETGGDAASYDRRVEAGFQFYKSLGINSIKTGYAGAIYPRGQHHHGQWMVRHYRRIVELAAQYEITLDVHEPIKPTGIRRTWPNMMTREGARGGEYEAWSEGNPPEHTTILPFTRLLAGPMDYTPGVFYITLRGYRNNERVVHTTLAKQLALMVIINSPLQMVADLPEHIRNHPALQFVRDLNIDWDESTVLDAEVGDYIVTTRRAGQEWFLAAITDEERRELAVNLTFLEAGVSYRAEIYRDGDNASWDLNPHEYMIETQQVNSSTTLNLSLATGGGIAIRLVPIL
ncbi:glycoside hydrolase family 97 protein [bacterium]|nr:glycoside hydrolase family 97 protein [bacterium]